MALKKDYEPEELKFVLPQAVLETFPLELDFSGCECVTDKDVIRMVNERFNATFPDNESATRYMDESEKEDIRRKYCRLVEEELPQAELEYLDAVEEAKRLKNDASGKVESLNKQIKDYAAKVHEGAKEKELPATKTFRIALAGYFLTYSIINGRVLLVKASKVEKYEKTSLWSQEDRNRIAMNELFGLEFPVFEPPTEQDLDLEPDKDGTDDAGGEDELDRELGYGEEEKG